MLVEFRDEVESALGHVFQELDSDVDVELELPPDGVDAEIACSSAFKMDGYDNPVEAAGDIVDALDESRHGYIDRVSSQGPYVNFRGGKEYFDEVLTRASSDDYPVFPDRDERVLLEHTSANPTGPLHVGRARNPIIGDSLARVLRCAGYDVEVEYYVNDMGRQVATITWALKNLGEADVEESERDKPDYDVVRFYRAANRILEGDDEESEIVKGEIDELLQALEEGSEEAHQVVGDAVDRCLEGQLMSLERLGAEFDGFVRESGFVLDGSVDEVIDSLGASDLSYMEDDAWHLDLSGYGLDKDFVFQRRDGTSLYTTRDVAYHMDKFSRCDDAVNVLGEDHKLQSEQLGAALDVLGVESEPRCVFYSYVNLPGGKMSTREGNVVNMDDLLDEAVERARAEIERRGDDRSRDIGDVDEVAEVIGIGAVRFDIVSRQPEKPITFRWEEALDFDGQRAPSIQYVYARTQGILENAGVDSVYDSDGLDSVEEVDLMRKIAELSWVVEDAALGLSPHRVAAYSRELAECFNDFYGARRVLDAGGGVSERRLGLVEASGNAVRRSLGLIGVDVPDAM